MKGKAVCLTVDLDRDANIRLEGREAAGSIDRGAGTAPRYASTEKGLELLSGLLDELGIRITYFAEAETLGSIDCAGCLDGHEVGMHGFAHEDLTGGDGAPLDAERLSDILGRSSDTVADIVGRRPRCFRAPYMKADARLLGMLPSFGVGFDSSEYAAVAPVSLPYSLGGGLTEVPVSEGRDASGRRITGYLWPMHEGRRGPQDFIDLSAGVSEGVFTIATHTWHLCEARERGVMDAEGIAANLANLREVLTGVMDEGFVPMTVPAAAERFPPAL